MKVTLQIVKDLIVSKISILRQIKNRLLFPKFIILLVEYFNLSTIDKVHLLDTALITNDCLSRILNPTVEPDDKFVDKALFTFFKKVVEVLFKFFELES